MAFAETAGGNRRVLEGANPVWVTLAGDVLAGDCIGYSSGWKLSASATTIQPLLVAGRKAVSGEIIEAYPLAVIEVTHSLANTATDGSLTALKDDGTYQAAGSNLPDVGFCVSVASDSLTSIHVICPSVVSIDTARS